MAIVNYSHLQLIKKTKLHLQKSIDNQHFNCLRIFYLRMIKSN